VPTLIVPPVIVVPSSSVSVRSPASVPIWIVPELLTLTLSSVAPRSLEP